MLRTTTMLLAAALLLGGCSAADYDPRPLLAGIAGGACRGAGSCSVVCADGSTLDGRPASARCRP